MTREELKNEMCNLIEAEGLPVGFTRCEGDSSWTVIVNKDRTTTLGGYAKDTHAGDTLAELSIADLGGLVSDGVRGDDLEGMRQYCPEEEQ